MWYICEILRYGVHHAGTVQNRTSCSLHGGSSCINYSSGGIVCGFEPPESKADTRTTPAAHFCTMRLLSIFCWCRFNSSTSADDTNKTKIHYYSHRQGQSCTSLGNARPIHPLQTCVQPHRSRCRRRAGRQRRTIASAIARSTENDVKSAEAFRRLTPGPGRVCHSDNTYSEWHQGHCVRLQGMAVNDSR